LRYAGFSSRPDRGGQRLYSDPEIEFIMEIAKLENEGINMPGVKAILVMRRGQQNRNVIQA